MTQEYKELDLVELAEALEALPKGARIQGVKPGFHSYRGIYAHAALNIGGDDDFIDAHELASYVRGLDGHVMYGWKGGEYYVNPNSPIALAEEGSSAHGYIIGIELMLDTIAGPDTYEFVLFSGYISTY